MANKRLSIAQRAARKAEMLERKVERELYAAWLKQSACECGHAPVDHADSTGQQRYPCERCNCGRFNERTPPPADTGEKK